LMVTPATVTGKADVAAFAVVAAAAVVVTAAAVVAAGLDVVADDPQDATTDMDRRTAAVPRWERDFISAPRE
jgi:hypothetical protein